MSADPYFEVSKIYRHLMQSINYLDWSLYIKDLKIHYDEEGSTNLELACGDGIIASYLKDHFKDLVILDISKRMLDLTDNEIKKVCADMISLPFKNKFSFIYSTFDSLNYLINSKDLFKLFTEIKLILKDDGLFTFDVSLEKNSIKNIKSLNRKGKFNGVKFIQKSKYNIDENIHTNHFKLKLDNGEIFEEVHIQKIYPFEYYFELIEDAGLYVVDCFDAFTFEDANNKCERVQFVIKKV